MTHLGSVDFIDAVSASGGGSPTESLTSGAFAAYDGAVLLESMDGTVALGDMASITDFSFDRMGAGIDLVVQHQPFNPGPGGSYQFTSGVSQMFSFVAATTGQYGVGISCSDEICVGGSAFTVQVSGNTATVPEPATGGMLGVGLLGLAASRRRAPVPTRRRSAL
jgi:hypothetical protein